MQYFQLIEELNRHKDQKFADFQQKIINPRAQKIIGVRTPLLRTLVKKYKDEYQTLAAFCDEYYEVTFLKLNVLALLEYEELLHYLPDAVKSIENWALCDTFKPKCIAKNREAFLPYLEKYLTGDEFSARFALVTLLNFYVEKSYLPFIFNALQTCDKTPYYAYMGASWLLSEVLVKHFLDGVEFLQKNTLDIRTHNKAIQKARESYRLSQEQKELLKTLKRK